jgi:uncharacterized integral membrane protein (TIGR00698 family)
MNNLFLVGLILSASGIISPPVALILGIVFGLCFEHPMRAASANLSRLLLQMSVVALGFGMDLRQVLRVGYSGFVYTAISITAAMLVGILLGKLLEVGRKSSLLICVGTAICGGSAIAAVSPITNATEEEVSVSMGTVFLLNSIALFLFPAVGHAMHLSQSQFGLWAALAIHDTSSVVGAASVYGSQALAIGTTVKLTRALWIVPVSLLTAAFVARSAKAKGESVEGQTKRTMPWFILFFCGAAAISTYVPRLHSLFADLNRLGKQGLTATLFLIGTSLSKDTLVRVGVRPLVQGTLLWIVVGAASLAAIALKLIAI